jgi:archaellum component FlaF (FlaF/FlaG flagellin family)
MIVFLFTSNTNKMKAFVKIKYILLIFAAAIFISSCEEAASDVEYGFPIIYMPQAATSGGIDNNYAIPNADLKNPNYTFDSIGGKLNVTLGVYRSGLQALDAYSVDVYVNADTTSKIISKAATNSLLPSDSYTLPSSIAVTSGKRESIIHLTLDVAKLNSNYPTLYGQTLVLAVGIKNPTKYEINKKLSTTILLVNSKKFMKKP